MRVILLLLLVFCTSVVQADTAEPEVPTFYTLNRHDGLSEDSVLQLMQLPDGRILMKGAHGIDLYDGISFAHIPSSEADFRPLPAYKGATHLYPDGNRLWVKERTSIACYNLQRLCPCKEMEVALPDSLLDFYMDHTGRQWWVMSDGIHSADGQLILKSPEAPHPMIVQDIDCVDGNILVFYQTGLVAAYEEHSGHLLYQSAPYSPEESGGYRYTSLVVLGPDTCIYQLRTGHGGGIFLRFSPQKRDWQQLFTADYRLHSLVILPSGIAYITLPDGYMSYDLHTGVSHHYTSLRLPDGSLLDTGVNAFCHDRTGGIWLGTYDKGIIYTSPLSGLFETKPLDLRLHPVLSSIFVHGAKVCQDSVYSGQVLTRVQAPYVRHLRLRHHQNSIAFQFSTMNYIHPRSTCYRYRLNGEWNIVTADSAKGGFVDNRGALYLPLVGLAPGDYRLEVMASTRPDHWDGAEAVTLTFEVMKPWWRTYWAYAAYLLFAIVVVSTLFWFFMRLQRRRMQRDAREQQLMMRIQNLVEQVNQYEHAAANLVLSEPEPQASEADNDDSLSPQDLEFMQRATTLVEQHLSDTQYTVEQLARDLCMERTGLYRRLTTLMATSPVVFIRGIRLHRAAELLKSGKYSVTEVSEMTGFGTVSYFGKCFFQEFGCKPSEYK